MPYKNGRYIRGGCMIEAPPSADCNVVEENAEKKILEKITTAKKEEAQSEDQKKERLKKFVSFKIK